MKEKKGFNSYLDRWAVNVYGGKLSHGEYEAMMRRKRKRDRKKQTKKSNEE